MSPMPWVNNRAPASPGVGASVNGNETVIRWQPDKTTAKVKARNGGTWRTMKIASVGAGQTSIPRADAIAVTALDRFGNASPPKVLALQ
jgi:hypothetical protein